MTLRIMLLGLVASMGFELPSAPEVSRWLEASRNWVDATVADRSGSIVEVMSPDVRPTDCCQARETCLAPVAIELPKACDDKAFEAVSNAMATDFAADVVAQATQPPTLEEETTIVEVAVETLEIPAVGLPSGEELVTQVIPEEKPETVAEVVEEPSMTVELTEEAQDRLDRISNAIRLTREAAEAWADVLQDSADETSPTQ